MYTTHEKISAYLGRELTANELIYIDDLIASVVSFVNAYTGKEWTAGAIDPYTTPVATERLYDGTGTKELFTDDFTLLESVKLLSTMGDLLFPTGFEPDNWILYPLNSPVKHSIYLRTYHYPEGHGNVEIKAVWGSGIVPFDVIMATTGLAGSFFKRNSATAEGQFQSESIEGYSYTIKNNSSSLDTETQSLISNLDKYKKYVL